MVLVSKRSLFFVASPGRSKTDQRISPAESGNFKFYQTRLSPGLAPVVHRVDDAIQSINRYPMDKGSQDKLH